LAEATALRKRCTAWLHSAAPAKDSWLYINKLAAISCSLDERVDSDCSGKTLGFCHGEQV
jgi:hypothetical protein